MSKERKTLKVGDSVVMPDPNSTDLWNHSFEAVIHTIKSDTVIVEDGEGNLFEIESLRLNPQSEKLGSLHYEVNLKIAYDTAEAQEEGGYTDTEIEKMIQSQLESSLKEMIGNGGLTGLTLLMVDEYSFEINKKV